MIDRMLCGFCGRQAQLTKEHVIPSWIESVLGRVKAKVSLVRGAQPTQSWPALGIDLSIHMPCAPCNNGWMHGLEEAVRPTLTPMIRGEGGGRLDGPGRTTVAAWATKTAMVAEYLTRDRAPYFTAEQRRELMVQRIPPRGVRVWMARYGGEWVGHARGQILKRHVSNEAAGDAYCSTFSIGALAFQLLVCHDPSALFRQHSGPWKETLLDLYPIGATEFSWPPSIALSHDAYLQLVNRFDFPAQSEDGELGRRD